MFRKNLLVGFLVLVISFALLNCVSYAEEDSASPLEVLVSHAEPLNIDELTKDNMIHLKINFLGTLEQKFASALSVTLEIPNFSDIVYEKVPIYGYIGDDVYIPLNRNIFKMPITSFSMIEPVGDEFEILCAYKAGTRLTDFERETNINILTNLFSGITIEPEEIFDFKEISGEFTADKGYEIALITNKGLIYFDYGGGAEQISSTLYAAIINNPNFEVIERTPNNPSALIVPENMDASVYGENNFKFINHYPFSIQIEIIPIKNESLVLIKKIL